MKSRHDAGEEIIFGLVPKNTRQMEDRIRASIEESKTERIVFGQVPKKRLYMSEYRRIQDRQGIEFGRVPKKRSYLGEYWRI